jgi:putative glutamine amidotransferase
MGKTNTTVVGITPDIYDRDGRPTWRVAETYARCVDAAGGVPIVLAPMAAHAAAQAGLIDALVSTGGDDPIMEDFDTPTHPEAVRVMPERQAFERAILDEAWARGLPTLGVCLGMQYMTLRAGGTLDQHMPETTPSAADHWERTHRVEGAHDAWAFGSGEIHSKHRQAMRDAGSLAVLARAHDGVIEAVGDVDGERPFWIGVQWHPERTPFAGLGQDLFDALVRAARAGRSR